MTRQTQPGMRAGNRARHLWAAALCAVVFVTVLVARGGWIIDYGSSLGFWDQWDAEAARLLKPAHEGTLPIAELVSPHNEHRIVLHRLWVLVVDHLNGGQWDTAVAALGSSAVWAAFLAMMVALWRPTLSSRWFLPVLLVLLAVTSLPYAWESLTVSLQAAFLQLIALTILSVHLASVDRLSFTRIAAVGVLCVLAMGTLASSLLTPLAAGAAFILRWWTTRRDTALSLAGLTIVAIVAAAGVATMHVHAGHAPLRAQSVGDFLSGLGVALSWPLGKGWIGALVLWLPWLALLARQIARRGSSPNAGLAQADRFFAILGLWVCAQAAAVAFSRGNGMVELGSRYAETIAFGLLVNAYAVWRWAASRPADPIRRWSIIAGCAGFTLMQLAVLHEATDRAAPHVEQFSRDALAQQTNVQNYVQTGDRDALWDKPRLDIPYPSPERLAHLLDDTTIRSFLPAVAHERHPLCASLGHGHRRVLLHMPHQACDASRSALLTLGVFHDADLPRCDEPAFRRDGLRTAATLSPAIDAATIARCLGDPALSAVTTAPLGRLSALLGTWRAPAAIDRSP